MQKNLNKQNQQQNNPKKENKEKSSIPVHKKYHRKRKEIKNKNGKKENNEYCALFILSW